jgi:hypothetical protein
MTQTEGGRRRLCLGASGGKLVGLAGILLLLLGVVVGLVVHLGQSKDDHTHTASVAAAGLAPSPPPLTGPDANIPVAAGVSSSSSSSSSIIITNDKQALQGVAQEATEGAVDQVVEALDPGEEGRREGGREGRREHT